MKKKSGYLKSFMTKRYPYYLIGLLILFVVDLLQIYIPKYLRELIDGIEYSNSGVEIVSRVITSIILIAVGIFVSRFMWRIFIIGSSRVFEKFTRNQMFKKLLKLSPSFFDKIKIGDIMARMTNDINASRMMLAQGIVLMTDSLMMGSFCIYMMITTVDPVLTMFGIIPLPILAFIAIAFGGNIHRKFTDVQDSFSGLTDTVQESLDGIRVVKSYALEEERKNRFGEKCRDYYRKNMVLIKLWGVFFPLIELMASLSIAITILYGGKLVIEGSISLGQFVAFSQYLSMLVWPMIEIGWVVNIIQRGRASYKRIMWVEEQKSDIVEPSNPKKADLKKRLSVKNMHFSYPGSEKTILKDIDIEILPGQTVAFVGKTGSGKSTLAKLLVKLYAVKDGSIFIGNNDINELSMKNIREQVAYVPQETFLFSTTIEENIAFSVDDYSQEEVKSYAQVAAIHSNIVDFPEGYKTVVGERGITLSGGQKQRVAIARALMKKTPVVILDDCLSAVDVETERVILESLTNEIKDRTTILISHRLKAMSKADMIYVFDNGRIIERGRHEQLLANGGFYFKLYQKQMIEETLEGKEF